MQHSMINYNNDKGHAYKSLKESCFLVHFREGSAALSVHVSFLSGELIQQYKPETPIAYGRIFF